MLNWWQRLSCFLLFRQTEPHIYISYLSLALSRFFCGQEIFTCALWLASQTSLTFCVFLLQCKFDFSFVYEFQIVWLESLFHDTLTMFQWGSHSRSRRSLNRVRVKNFVWKLGLHYWSIVKLHKFIDTYAYI